LVDRVGKLAAESLLTWLRRHDLEATERAKACGLLPEWTPLNTGLLSGAAAQLVLNAFRERINHEKLLLCGGGHLDRRHYTVRLPTSAIEAWGVDTARAFSSPKKRSVLAREVPADSHTRRRPVAGYPGPDY